MEKSQIIKGILCLTLVPVVLLVVIGISLFFSLMSLQTLVFTILYTGAIFVVFLFKKNSYTDSEVLDKVQIPNAPVEIDELLRKKTRSNRLINVNILLVLGKKRRLSQSDLSKRIEDLGIEYSQTAIIKYLTELAEEGLLQSKKEYTREYCLTQKGEWCYHAVKKCFPNRFFFFIIRHYLGIRKLPPFPQKEQDIIIQR